MSLHGQCNQCKTASGASAQTCELLSLGQGIVVVAIIATLIYLVHSADSRAEDQYCTSGPVNHRTMPADLCLANVTCTASIRLIGKTGTELELSIVIVNNGTDGIFVNLRSLPWNTLSLDNITVTHDQVHVAAQSIHRCIQIQKEGVIEIQPSEEVGGAAILKVPSENTSIFVQGHFNLAAYTVSRLPDLETRVVEFGPLKVDLRQQQESGSNDGELLKIDYLKSAKMASKNGDFEAASEACRSLEARVGVKDESRRLRLMIQSQIRRAELLQDGIQALKNLDYDKAESSLQEASTINPTITFERVLKKTRALRLYAEAKSQINAGLKKNAIEQLKASVWLFPIPEAKCLLAELQSEDNQSKQ